MALRSGLAANQATARAGFSSDTQLRRDWHHLRPGGPPSTNVALLQTS